MSDPDERANAFLQARGLVETVDSLPLFGGGGNDGVKRFGRAISGITIGPIGLKR